jgi:hypothetical protein
MPAPSAPSPAAPPPGPAAPPATEAEAWARVEAAWEDVAAHRAYLARCTSLEELAAAGRRYRDALAARPGDPVAGRMREELVKRATVVGLSTMPRTAPPTRSPTLRRILVAAYVAIGVLGAWAAYHLLVLLGNRS